MIIIVQKIMKKFIIEIMKNRTQSRLNKELKDLDGFPNFHVVVDPNDSKIWRISFKGADGTLYAGENFTLQFKFGSDYVRKIFYF